MITPTSALIVVPLLSGRPQARQKQQATREIRRGLSVRIRAGEPAEGRAVYRNEADKQPPLRPSVIVPQSGDLLTQRSADEGDPGKAIQ